jgi:hypothetical protein
MEKKDTTADSGPSKTATTDLASANLAHRVIKWQRRVAVIIAAVVLQTAMFWAFMQRPPTVLVDNFRYEEPAFHLANGRGMSLPFPRAPDTEIRGWVCAKHPDHAVCHDASVNYPTAVYPPGYSVFLAGVYAVAGRSLWVVEGLQWALLIALIILFEAVCARYLDEVGYWCAIVLAATYPFLARQASMIMSDHVHAFLLFAALAAFLLMKPGVRRGLTFGLLFSAATLTRPYSMFCIPVLFAFPQMWRAFRADKREWLVALAAVALPFVVWTARNWYWYGHLVPFSTMGLGGTLYSLTLESRVGDIYDPARAKDFWSAFADFDSIATVQGNRQMTAAALAWMAEHPGAIVKSVLMHAPKLWISLGTEGSRLGPSALVLVPYMGVVLILGLVGFWLKRRDRQFWLLLFTIVPYWGFLLTSPEARRTLPLRLPMLLFVGVAASHLWHRFRRPAEASAKGLPIQSM